jgi:hypothetical protein
MTTLLYKVITIILLGLLTTFNLYALDSLNTRLYEYAKGVPLNRYDKIDNLVKYLSLAANSESERVEIFTYWISLNISYDTYEYSIRDNWSKNITHNFQDAYPVFKTRKAICAGYSNLLKKMCEAANIKCYNIEGYSKGFGYAEGVMPNRPDHMWNAVFIDSKWVLVDATWTTGFAKMEGGKMVATNKLDLQHIFANPKEFILKHLPLEPQWQLLTNPVSMAAFFSSSSYNQMTNNEMPFYNFNDTIRLYEDLPMEIREIKSAENIYRFTQDKWRFAFDCFHYAQSIDLQYIQPPAQGLVQAVNYYVKAKEMFDYFSGTTASSKGEECIERINNLNNRIRNQNER